MDALTDGAESITAFERFKMDELRIGVRIVYEVEANWKIVVENYNECLHCPQIHPELVQVVPLFRFGEVWDEEIRDDGNRMMEGATSFTISGTSELPKLPGLLPEDYEMYYGLYEFPNLMLNLHPDCGMYYIAYPKGPNHTTVVSEFLFRPETIEGADFKPEPVDRALGPDLAAGLGGLPARADRRRLPRVHHRHLPAPGPVPVLVQRGVPAGHGPRARGLAAPRWPSSRSSACRSTPSGAQEAPSTVRRSCARSDWQTSVGADAGDLDVRIRGEVRDPVTGILGSPDVLTTTASIRQATAAALTSGERPFLVGGCCTVLPGALAAARDVAGTYRGRVPRRAPRSLGRRHVADGRGRGHAVVGGARSWSRGVGRRLRRRDVAGRGRGADRLPRSGRGPHVRADRARARAGVPTRLQGRGTGGGTGSRRANASQADLASRAGRFWMHLDVDILGEDEFPATDYLMPDGLNMDELVALMRPLAASPALIGVSVGCYNPEKDPGDVCGRALVEAFRATLAP